MANKDHKPDDSMSCLEVRKIVADGRKHAAAMLREFAAVNADEAAIESRYRPGKPQCDILRRYLRAVGECNRPGFAAGFNAVLTDFLAHAGDGAPEPTFYEALDDADIARKFTDDEEGPASVAEAPAIVRGHLTLVHSRA